MHAEVVTVEEMYERAKGNPAWQVVVDLFEKATLPAGTHAVRVNVRFSQPDATDSSNFHVDVQVECQPDEPEPSYRWTCPDCGTPSVHARGTEPTCPHCAPAGGTDA